MNTPKIPLASRIVALVPGLGAIGFFGITLPVTVAVSLELGPVRWMGYLPSALLGAGFGVSAALFILVPTLRVIAAVNGAPFQKGDMVQVLNGKHKGAKGRVEKPIPCEPGDYNYAYHHIVVDVDGESAHYGDFDIFLIERINGEAPDDSL